MTEISETADKAMTILAELAYLESATPQQLATRMGVSRTIVQRLLTTLLARDFVVRAAGEYALSSRMWRLSSAVFPRLRRAVEPQARQLSARTGETVVFQVVDGSQMAVLVEARQTLDISLQVRHEVGARSPILQTSSGLSVLAALPPTEAAALMRADGGIDEELAARLDAIRRRGHARSSDDLQPGVSGIGMVVRAGSRVAGSLAVLVPSARVTQLDDYRRALGRTVARIERALG